MAQPKITIVKAFTYKGKYEEFSNSYHFTGTKPTDAAGWKTLADAIITAEKPSVPPTVTFVRAYGYAAGNNHSEAQIDYTVSPLTPAAGTLVTGGVIPYPGDVVVWVRWPTGQLNARGRKVYLRKYFHGILPNGSTPEGVSTAQKTALATFAAKLIDGTLPGTFVYSDNAGHAGTSPSVDAFATVRTLKRRGKRNPT